MRRLALVAGFALLFGAASATVCTTNDFACTGRKVTLTSGECATVPSPCEDHVDCTTDQCSDLGICSNTVSGTNCPECTSDCDTYDCEGKQCGNDGCGGFCGVCAEGEGCDSNSQCTTNQVTGSCTAPIPMGTISGTVTKTFNGDTSASDVTHTLTPLCNFRSGSPELIYTFTIPAAKRIGYEIRTTGYDTVLAVMKGHCQTNATVSCNDDATPPGDYGSSVSGMLTAGTYFVMVDGYDSEAKGPFTMTARFIEDCQPKCDGAFCGTDGCGFTCGTCGEDETCHTTTARCYPTDCTPKCGQAFSRTCGEDGCGGICGTCDEGEGCIHASITPEESEGNIIPPLVLPGQPGVRPRDPPVHRLHHRPVLRHRLPVLRRERPAPGSHRARHRRA
jgi:hypothetical protein